MKLEPILSASKKFLRTRETMYVFPSMQAFARLVDATLELHKSFVPEGTSSNSALIAYAIWRLVLTTMGDVTRFWNKWLTF